MYVKYYSSDENVATVTDGGTVIAGDKVGTCEITATYKHSVLTKGVEYTAKCQVEVTAEPESFEFSLLNGENKIADYPQKTYDFSVKILPEDASQSINCTTTDVSIVCAVLDTKKIYLQGEGEAKLCFFSTENPSLKQEIDVEGWTYVSDLMHTSYKETMNVGETQKLEYTMFPAQVHNNKVVWESYNDCLSVDQEGNVTAVQEGSGRIYAKTVDGSEKVAMYFIDVSANDPQLPEKIDEDNTQEIPELEPSREEKEVQSIASGDCTVSFNTKDYKFVATVTEVDDTVKELHIPTEITYAGQTYTVTGIAPGLFAGNCTIEKLVTGDGLLRIDKGAFASCKNLKTVILGEQVVTVGDSAFKGCSSLEKIVLSKNTRIIGKSAFANCKNLKSITLGKNVTTIPDSAFEGCKKLKKITIPSNVKTIGKKAFYNCSSLKSVTIKGKVLKKVGKNAFTKIAKKATIKVPKSKKKAYEKLIKVSKGTKIK